LASSINIAKKSHKQVYKRRTALGVGLLRQVRRSGHQQNPDHRDGCPERYHFAIGAFHLGEAH
jgi:hypothetical protein